MSNFSPEKVNENPFQNLETIAEGKYFEVKTTADDPDIVVKEARTNWKKGEEVGVHPLADENRIKADLDVLGNNFAEYLPATSQPIIGKNEQGENTVYIIQDTVEGKSLENIEYDANVAEQLKSFLNRVIDTYINNLCYHGKDSLPQSVFPDIKGKNFIFGKDKKKGDQHNRLYFIDIYPIEGDYTNNFVNAYITLIRQTFSKDYSEVFDWFQKEAENRIAEYLSENRDTIKRVN